MVFIVRERTVLRWFFIKDPPAPRSPGVLYITCRISNFFQKRGLTESAPIRNILIRALAKGNTTEEAMRKQRTTHWGVV